MKIINRAAKTRLLILLGAFIALGFWLWMTVLWMPGQSYRGAISELSSEEVILRQSLQQTVRSLAADIGARNASQYDRLNESKALIEKAFTDMNYPVTVQTYDADGRAYYNLEVEKLGTDYPDEIVVVGAHYDTAFDSPGANDNATGVAATLALAEIFKAKSPKRTVRFVAFTNEEPPFFWTEQMGSLRYARQLHQAQEKVVSMLSLETMGYFSDVSKSQKYPFPVNLFYPETGNFIGFIGNLDSSSLVKKSIKSFRRQATIPSEGVALPSTIPGVGWSDQWSFWQQGYPGIMVTDTATYRDPHYHTNADTLDKIDFDKLTKVVSGLTDVISDLADT